MLSLFTIWFGSRAHQEPPLFRNPLVRGRIGWNSLACSAWTHVLGLAVVWLLGTHPFCFYAPYVPGAYHVDLIRLQIPERLYYSKPIPRPAADPPRPRPRPAGALASSQAALAAAPKRELRPWIPPQLELPPSRKAAVNAPVILQPDVPVPPALAQLPVPAVEFWARQDTLPKPPRRRFVVPGRVEAPSPPPCLDALPVLDIPNRQPVLRDLNVALAPAAVPLPAVVLPNSSPAPIRNREDRAEARAASLDTLPGQPLNLITIGGQRRPAGEVALIQPGLQNIPSPSPGGEGAGEANSADRAAAGDSSPQARRGSGTAARSGSAGNAEGPGALPAAAAAATASSGNASSANVSPDPNPPRSPAAQPDAQVTRIVHGAHGSFDVIIQQSASREDLPDVAGLLKGSPVYTVYLGVGDRKEWLLEYCLPSAAGSQGNPNQIVIGSAQEISPPHPEVTVVPNSVLAQQRLKPTVLHGFITAAGRLRDVASPEGDTPLARQLLPALVEWVFGPALKRRDPVEVEILLIVPARL